MRKIYYITLILTLLILFISCGKGSTCFKSTGEIVKEQRIISDIITHIVTEDNIDIVITQSNKANLTVRAGKNLLPYINTDVSGSVLSIFSTNRCGLFRDNTIPITVYLSIPDLVKIDYTGQGDITSTNTLNFPFFEIESEGGTGSINLNMNTNKMEIKQHAGPADFTITGNVNTLYLYTSGTGWFYFNKLISNTTHINHSGIGNIFVNVQHKLSVELRSRGSVFYTGNPLVKVSPYLGSGTVEKE